MSIKITGTTDNKDYTIKDDTKDGKINSQDSLNQIQDAPQYKITVNGTEVSLTGAALKELLKQADFMPGDNKKLEELLKEIEKGSGNQDMKGSEIEAQLDTLADFKTKLEAAIQKLDAPSTLPKAVVDEQLKVLKAELALVTEKVDQILKTVQENQDKFTDGQKNELKNALEKAGIKNVDLNKSPDPSLTQKTQTPPPAGKASTSDGTGQSGGSTSGSATGPTGGPKWSVGVPGGPQTWFEGDGGMGMNPSSLMQMDLFNDAKLSAIDQLGKSDQQRRVMLLFFYFARMAMSGDMGAMYQFMMFLTTIISRDKALQNINMGKLLLQQQDMSRKATSDLMKVQANMEPGDDDAARDLQVQLQQTKQTESDVATSQKLISQMMEEMTQVVETLTNATKGALEAQGRILRSVSRIG